MRKFELVPGLTVGADAPLLVIAGPCQIESLEHCLKIAEFAKKACAKHGFGYVFKASFDKANRTSLAGARGPGLAEGLEILSRVKEQIGVPLITDVHDKEQVQLAAKVVDVLQTPAFLCRQTDLLIAAGATGKPVNVKKGQFLHPSDMAYVAEKISSTGNSRVMLCERGTSFGYRDLVLDPRGLVLMRQTGYPVVFDATHTVQSLGGASGKSGGNREFIDPLVRAAVAIGVDGLFLEIHDNPDQAPSDGASMLPLEAFPKILEVAARIRSAAGA